MTEANEVQIPIYCKTEGRAIGHLRLIRAQRPKILQPQLAWSAFEPEDSRYQLPEKLGSVGDYWFCPHCRGYLCIEAEVQTGETYPPGHPQAGKPAPPMKNHLVPVILGRSRLVVG